MKDFLISPSILPLTSSTKIPGMSSDNNTDIYVEHFSYDINNTAAANFNFSTHLKLSLKNGSNDEFGVTNVKVIQFKCSKNCL
jgi:hypothetical protein